MGVSGKMSVWEDTISKEGVWLEGAWSSAWGVWEGLSWCTVLGGGEDVLRDGTWSKWLVDLGCTWSRWLEVDLGCTWCCLGIGLSVGGEPEREIEVLVS